MNILFWGLTIGVIGKVLLAIGVLRVHSRIVSERGIDQKVLKDFMIERITTVIGIILIVTGYLLEIYFYDFASFLTCEGANCATSAGFIMLSQ